MPRPVRDTGQDNPRRPCSSCGSGKRYKACHGSAGGAEDIIVVLIPSGQPTGPEPGDEPRWLRSPPRR